MALYEGYDLSPKYVMTDFEKGLQNSIALSFPTSKSLGCEFHFVKALWKKAGKLGLKKDSLKQNTRFVIGCFVVLGHIEDTKQRKFYFEELQEVYEELTQENTSYATSFTYFKNKWLNIVFISNEDER